MAISPPNYQRDAIPTPRGWVHPRTGELLVSRKISESAINEYLDIAPEPQMLKESPTNFEEAKVELMTEDNLPSEYQDMTKKELETLGREHGIELDRRKNKADLIEELKEVI
tara:strand:+ start:777 stop:1112 length:336 start_codon:yes stop_codon:yes gene_type:complete